MFSEEYIASVRARAIVALHTRRLHPEFVEIAERDIATMPLEPRGYRCDRCNHITCGNCGRCHMIDAAPDEKICPASKNRRVGCAEWRQAYDEIQYVLQVDAGKGVIASAEDDEETMNDTVTLPKAEIERLKKIEEAARIAFAHLTYLDNCGVLTRKEEPMMEAFREALS